MNGRDKMLAAMTSGLQGDFPVVIPYLDILLRDHWEEITDRPWWTVYDLDLPVRLKVEGELQRKLDIDWVPCGLCPPREWRDNHRVETQKGRVFLVSNLSGEMKEIRRQPMGGAHIPIEKEPLIKSVEDVDRYVNVIDEEDLIHSGRLDYARIVAEEFESEKFVFASIGTPYWTALDSYFGFKGMMTNLFRRPKLVEYTLERILACRLQELKACAKVGVDGVWIEECLGSADEISLDQFRHFALSYNREIISEVRRLSMNSIYYPCGDVRDRLDLIVDSNPDCISLEESKKGFEIDIAWVNETVGGRACIFGNLDALDVLPNGTSTELRREIQRQVNIGRMYGKFVMSLGSPVTPKTPLSRVREYVNIARQQSKDISLP